jgi:hypothetical protein
MLNSLRQREGKYTQSKLAAIRQGGGSEIKMMLTDVKCRAAEAMVLDVFFGSGERPFSFEPTALPDIPEELLAVISEEAMIELQQVVDVIPNEKDVRERVEFYVQEVKKRAKDQAKKACRAMEDAVDDEFQEGDWYEAMPEVISDLITLKAAILRGPETNMVNQLVWQPNPGRPNSVTPQVERVPKRKFYAVSPFDIYPSPEARTFDEGTLIQRRRIAPHVLYDMIGVEGFDEQAIRTAIKNYGESGYKDWLWHDFERSQLEGRPYEHIYGTGTDIDVLECWTQVSGKKLKEWGLKNIEDEEKYYEANCWLVGNVVIRATLNDDPLGKRPYHADSFVRIRNSPWGRGVPEIMSDLQDMCDAAARAISNNMGLASGPQVEVEVDRLADGEKVTKIHPWRIWQTTASKVGGGINPAVRFYQPDTNVQALMAVFQFFSNLADEYTGLPKYQYGSGETGGAGRTASGLSMLMNATSRLFKQVISHVDNIIGSCAKLTHRNVLMYDEAIENKGDVRVIAKASQALLHREAQQMRIIETLNSTNNPIDFGLMGPEGRLELVRASMRGLDAVDVDKVLPTDDEMLLEAFAANQQLQSGPQQGSQPAGPQQQQPVAQGMA